MSDYQKESQFLRLIEFLKQNPGLSLSIAYVLLTLCGIIYSMAFYKEFDIDILQLASLSDLMMTGVSEPAAIFMFSAGLLIAYISDVISQYSYDVQKRWRAKPKSVKRSIMLTLVYTPEKSSSVMFFFLSMFAIYAFLFVSWYAEWKSERVKNGNDELLAISVSDEKYQFDAVLLGSTTNFILFYSRDTGEASIHSVDRVDSIRPIRE